MRIFFFAVAATIGTAGWADTFTPHSKLTSVIVHTFGAKATRVADLSIPAGVHQIILRETQISSGKSGVEFQTAADSGVSIISSEYQQDGLKTLNAKDSPEYRAKEAKLIAAEQALATFNAGVAQDQAAIKSADIRIEFLRSLAGGNAPFFPEDGAINPADLGLMTRTIGDQIVAAMADKTAAEQRINAGRREQKKLNTAVRQAQLALNLVTPSDLPELEMVLTVNAARQYTGPLTINYLTTQVGWEPTYNLRLAQTEKTGTLTIERRAMVRQVTGENWQDVSVTLSTANLRESLETHLPPEDLRRLDEQTVALRKTMRSATAVDEMVELESKRNVALAGSLASEPIMMSPQSKGQTIEFELANLVNLRSSNGGSVFELDEIAVDLDLFAQANTKHDAKAFLYAELENTTQGNLLAGPMQLYRDGAYLGEGIFPAITKGDTVELPLGPIDGLLVEHRTVSREDGDRGLITSSDSRSLRLETTFTSLLDYDIALRAYENTPVSEDEDLVIKEVMTPRPTERDIEGKRGVLRWDLEMKAGSKRTIQTGYDMTWPTDKILR